MSEDSPPVLSRSILPTKKKLMAISELFDLDYRIVEKFFQNKECYCLFRVKHLPHLDSERRIRKTNRDKLPQNLPGPGSTKIRYKCQAPGCKEFRYLTDGEAKRKGYIYYCACHAQLFRRMLNSQ